MKKQNYAEREAVSFKNRFKKHNYKSSDAINKNYKYEIYYKSPILIRPFLLFIYSYFFKLGFLSGWQGLIYNFFQVLWYKFIVDMKIIQLSKK